MVLWLLDYLWHVGQRRTLAYSQPFAFLYKNLKLLDNLLKRFFVYFTLFNDQVIVLDKYITWVISGVICERPDCLFLLQHFLFFSILFVRVIN